MQGVPLSTTDIVVTAEQTQEAVKLSIRAKRYRPMRLAGIPHEMIITVAVWCQEQGLDFHTVDQVMRALLAMRRHKIPYDEIKRFLGCNPARIREFSRLISFSALSIDECFEVMIRMAPRTYLKRLDHGETHAQILKSVTPSP